MRHPIAAACLLATTACSIENELRYTATLEAETNGVALSDDGLDAYAAMSGTTCRIDTSWGCPTSDADLPTDHERVVDHWNGRTLGASDLGVHTIEGQAWLADFDLEIHDVVGARLTEAGTLVLAGDANSCVLSDTAGSIEVPVGACSEHARTDVDRAGSAMFAATADGVFELRPDGVRQLSDTADLVASDPVSGLVVIAERGDTVLTALDASGETVWAADTTGPIESIATRGDRGQLLVLVRDGEFGRVERRDTRSGEVDGTSSVPSVEGELVVSGNGHTIGIVRLAEVHWYAMELDGEAPVVDPEVESCMDAWERASRD
ncbi:MAG: hypothetical protein H6737_12180 [Alphaproteobacteria bacterium]|nr:hypothetical protein [Alphaproteobacteria bacterium]